MDVETQRAKADALRELHKGPEILILPNTWDVGSARFLAGAGFSAMGTTSAGIAFALGYPDGERISREQMLDVVGRITAAVFHRLLVRLGTVDDREEAHLVVAESPDRLALFVGFPVLADRFLQLFHSR